MTTTWQYFPRWSKTPEHMLDIVEAFDKAGYEISTPQNQLSSDEVLQAVAPHLKDVGFVVETGKTHNGKIQRPVLYGKNGVVEKTFEVDAWEAKTGTVIEVEAGRGVVNHQFLKDFFEACVIQDAIYLVIAVCKAYKPPSFKNPSKDFETVCTFMETLYAFERLKLPLQGILIVGY